MSRVDKKGISIPIIPVIIILIALFVVIFKVGNFINSKAIASTEEETETTIDESEFNILENMDIEEPEKEEPVTPRTVTYTAPNGQTYEIAGTVNIPSLNINYPILATTSTALLKVSVCKYWGANANEVGNMVVVGHNYRNSKFFSKLLNIKKGDIIEITDLDNETLEYSVYEIATINPYDNSCTSQLTNGHTEVTLITCTNDSQNRVVVKARAN